MDKENRKLREMIVWLYSFFKFFYIKVYIARFFEQNIENGRGKVIVCRFTILQFPSLFVYFRDSFDLARRAFIYVIFSILLFSNFLDSKFIRIYKNIVSFLEQMEREKCGFVPVTFSSLSFQTFWIKKNIYIKIYRDLIPICWNKFELNEFMNFTRIMENWNSKQLYDTYY